MSTNDTVEHDEVQQLLPWFINQQLAPGQREQVNAHLRHCADCRADVGEEQLIRLNEPPLQGGLDAERALARLMPRLEPQVPAVKAVVPAPRRSWMAWALAGQGALIAALLVVILPMAEAPADYRALSGAKAGVAGNVVVVFRPEARLDTVQRILQASGARMVDGPTSTGAYVLQVPEAQQAKAIAELKADAGVELVEALSGAGRP